MLFLAAFGLRLGVLVARGTFGRTSEHYREYIYAGQGLLSHGTLVSPLLLETVDLRPSALLPPGYAAFCACVYALLGVDTSSANAVLHLTNCAASALAVVFVFLSARSLGGGVAGWIAAIIAAINPTLIGFAELIWDTSLLILGVSITLWLAVVLGARRRRAAAFLGFGLWLGLLALLNPALTIAYPLLVLWPIVRDGGSSTRAAVILVAASVLGWMIAILPWTLRNHHHFDKWIYVRGGFMLEVWLGVCPEAEGEGGAVYTNQFPLLNADVQRHLAKVGEGQFVGECGEKAVEAIKADPMRLARLIAVRAVDYWAGTAFSHSRPGESGIPAAGWRRGVMAFLLVETAALMVLCAMGGATDGSRKWLWGMIVLFSLMYCLTHVQVRYRAPGEPIVAVLLGLQGSAWFRRSGAPAASRSSG